MADQNTHDLNNQQLLSAYIDGELGGTDRALAEKLIRDNPHFAQMAEQWRESGINLRALPKKRLDDGFADRVLGSINETGDRNGVAHPVEPIIDGNSPGLAGGNLNPKSNGPMALFAIGALCASLLLTLFAFPALVNKSPSAGTPVAANNLETQPEIELKPEIDASLDEGEPQSNVASFAPIVRAPRSMKMAGAKSKSNGGAVTAIEIDQPAQTAQNVEQILHIEVADSDQLDLEKVLKAHSIKTVGTKESDSTADSNVEAIYALASLDQMHSAAEQLAEEFSAKVTIVPVPLAPVDVSSAVRLESRSFSSQSSNAEIAQLDHWFGLAQPGDDSRSIRFLILLTR